MASYESYADRHSKQRSVQGNRSKSRQPTRSIHSSVENLELIVSDLNSKVGKTEFQQLALKVAQSESKIVSLTNIVKLVQKYTQTQDLQYQKERQTFMNREAVLNSLIMDQQRRLDKQEKRIFQIDELYQQYKSQFENIRKFRDVGSANTESSKTFKFDHRQHLSQIEMTQAIKIVQEKLRLELNRKIEICMDEVRNVPTRQELHSMIEDVRSAVDANQTGAFRSADDRGINQQIESIKQTINSLVSSRTSPARPILKSKDKASLKQYVKFHNLIEFRQQVDAKLKHIVDKFSNVVKRYVGKSVSPMRPTQSTSEKPTMRKDHKSSEQVRQNLNPNISDYNNDKGKEKSKSKSKSKKNKTDEVSNPDQKSKKAEKIRSRSKSRSKSRSRSLSKHSHKSKNSQSDNSSRPSSRPKGIVDRRKQKEQQLKEMMRKTKEQKQKISKDRKILVR